MMLWDIIRDWFVINIFGGYTSNGDSYNVSIGFLKSFFENDYDDDAGYVLNDITFKVFNYPNGYSYYMGLSDWLSTMSTLIVLIAVCVALFFLVRYFFRMFAGLLSGR